MKTTVSSKGQIILPAQIRRQDQIEAGQEFDVERLEAGQYKLTRAAPPRNHGLVKLLLACPVKDWFQPAARTESTNDLRIHRLG